MEYEGSLPLSQKPDTCSYSEPKQPSPFFLIPFLENPPKYYSPTYVWAYLPSNPPHLIIAMKKTITVV